MKCFQCGKEMQKVHDAPCLRFDCKTAKCRVISIEMIDKIKRIEMFE